ncbi:MAG: hypothetical protein NC517_12060 [Firmicutes bacterium]|nr:hypothetical protein [Bacillota bacterium]
MSLLNKQAYVMEKDRLIYDAKHPIDGAAVVVKIQADADGVIKRGQLLDCEDGVYRVHAADGKASAIVAEDAGFEAGETEITAAVYISGSFRASEVIANPEITDKDVEALRGSGIYLK